MYRIYTQQTKKNNTYWSFGMKETRLTELFAFIGAAPGFVCSIKTDRDINVLLATLPSPSHKVRKLSPVIYDVPESPAVCGCTTNIINKANTLSPESVLRFLEPVQKIFGAPILTSALTAVPEEMMETFDNNPWEILENVRPTRYAKLMSDSDLVPLLFRDEGVYYIGWHKLEAFRNIFGCKFTSDCRFWFPKNIRDNKPVPVPVDDGEDLPELCPQCGHHLRSPAKLGVITALTYLLFIFLGMYGLLDLIGLFWGVVAGAILGFVGATVTLAVLGIVFKVDKCPNCGAEADSGAVTD